ncbi:hypothetical protein M9H77_07727 [Catharanthus roseus]|uniref:Uncharacterized protein n=1 Tax=Catharanthus roseus TaxID=4058 RepID=A0ACC0BVQ9_CATRO|nr:hypothetical protein M9H77_07727 [Catharanthus roseus]
MNAPASGHDDDGIVEEGEEVFLEEGDIIEEIPVDEEELPDTDDEEGSDSEVSDEADDSLHTFTGHTGELYTVACSPTDPTFVATGGGDDKGFLWSIGQGDWAFELQDHMDSISSLAFSSNGQLAGSGSFDGLVKVWDISTRTLKWTLEGPSGGIEMGNAVKGAYLNMFAGHGGCFTCGDFTPDGKTICAGSDDATMRIWNPRSDDVIHIVRGHSYHTDGLTCLSVSSDSTLALSGSKDGSLHIVNITTGKVVSSLSAHSDSIECVGHPPPPPPPPQPHTHNSFLCISFSCSSPWAATGGMDQKLGSLESSAFITSVHEGVTCLSWLGSSRYLATGSVDGKVRLWDSLSGDCSLAVSATSDFLVSVSLDTTARVFCNC